SLETLKSRKSQGGPQSSVTSPTLEAALAISTINHKISQALVGMYTKMSLQNFSNDEYAYSEESQLLPNEESSELLSKESPLLSDKQQPLSLDKDPLLLDDELSLDEPSIDSKPVSDEESLLLLEGSSNSTQNTITEASKSSQQNIIVKRKSNSNLRNNNANKKSKPGKSWVSDDNLKQCTSTFEIATSTTNLASHLRTVHRLSKTGPSLPLSGEKETAQLQPVRLDPSQSTLLELVNHQIPLSNKKQNKITSRILAWIVDDMQPFNDILHEAEPQFQFLDEDIVKQKLFESVNYSENGLKNLINNTLEYFAFTTDLWTKFHIPYIGITVHWLSSEFKMHKALLTIESFSYPHTSEHIEDCLRRELVKWNLSDKCVAGVTDNASSMVKALKDIGILHIRCTSYTIQLGVRDGL
ncbi:221_t:CDS:2, partial [Cetraspora pellucida]